MPKRPVTMGRNTHISNGPIFNADGTLASALLDHVETVLIEGKSYRGQAHGEA